MPATTLDPTTTQPTSKGLVQKPSIHPHTSTRYISTTTTLTRTAASPPHHHRPVRPGHRLRTLTLERFRLRPRPTIRTYTIPYASIASATLTNPPTLAPVT